MSSLWTDSALVPQLPDAAGAVVALVVKRSRLRGAERRELADELAAHFLDGIEAGESIDELVACFGSAEHTADMIRDAKRLARPLAWRALQKAVATVLFCVGFVVLAYATRAVSLYLHQPFRSAQASTDVQAAVGDIRAAWALATPETQAEVTTARQLFTASIERVRMGDFGGTDDAMTRLRAMSGNLRTLHSVAGDLAAVQIDEFRYDLILAGPLALAGQVSLEDDPVHVLGVRRAFEHLLDEMYTRDQTGDGHLTGEGIEKLRQLKQWHQPTRKDRLMEPVWYALPARRSDCMDRFENLVKVAETGVRSDGTPATVMELVKPLTTVRECLRYPSISAVLEELHEVLSKVERCRGKKRRVSGLDGSWESALRTSSTW
jgi:hypothetical protein